MGKNTDIRIKEVQLYFIQVTNRVPLKFGAETVVGGRCARACIVVEDRQGKTATGWGETPLSPAWVWPSKLSFAEREDREVAFCETIAESLRSFGEAGHPLELGFTFQTQVLPKLLQEFNARHTGQEPLPWLAALVCSAAFDMALHDAFGILLKRPTYSTYGSEFCNYDLSHFLEGAEDTQVSFKGRHACDFLAKEGAKQLPVWHLVGGVDPIDESELTGSEPDDGYPVLLRDWIRTDGLNCLKIKLRGTDSAWDYQRLVAIGKIAEELNVDWLTTDFNCTVSDPDYVNEILDRLCLEHPRIYGSILYVEQPFPYDLENNRIDVHSVSARKPLFLDESAHDWEHVRLGRSLGWTGVALKTCKTQTGALLSACWAKAHGMTLMVQDLTNPMLAMVPHVQLAAHVGTIMGIECNSMQFYPEASKPEAQVHPGLYQRRNGVLDLSSLGNEGFGYRIDEIERTLD